jgi:hypothetical protein
MTAGPQVLAQDLPLEVDRIPLMLVAVMFVAGAAFFAVWIWALVDAIKVPDDGGYRAGNKLVWVLVIVLTGALGAIVYLVVGLPGRMATRPPTGPSPTPPPPPLPA